MEREGPNWRGVAIFGLAVVTAIVLIRVIDDEPARLGVGTAGTAQEEGGSTVTTAPTITSPGAGATTTTAPTTTTFPTAGRPTLSAGMSGPDVTALQERLGALGYYTATVDGSFGPSTTAAVIAFQTKTGITPADGVVGPATWAALATAT